MADCRKQHKGNWTFLPHLVEADKSERRKEWEDRERYLVNPFGQFCERSGTLRHKKYTKYILLRILDVGFFRGTSLAQHDQDALLVPLGDCQISFSACALLEGWGFVGGHYSRSQDIWGSELGTLK